MNKDVWKILRETIRSAERSVPQLGRRRLYSDGLIVRMYFLSVAHDRTRCWACDRSNLSPLIRCVQPPSVSQFCKRLKTPRVIAIIDLVSKKLAASAEPVELVFIDGKALPVSESSRDPDAHTGHGNGRFSRGFKLHALGDSSNRIRAFRITAMNGGEPTVAREHLVKHVPSDAIVLADGNYDGRDLYTEIGARGATLLTPQKKNRRTEAAFRKTSPERRAAMERWRDEPEATQALYRKRGQIERIFSALTCFAGGLAPLPSWVRRIDRVTRWVTVKIAIYHARLRLRMLAS